MYSSICKTIAAAALLLMAALPELSAQTLPYKDASLPVEKRVEDLLQRMTPEEKFWQLFMVPGDLTIGKDKLATGIFGFQIATQSRTDNQNEQVMNYAGGGEAADVARQINQMQHYFLNETRLGIPIIPFDEALHGLVRDGATAFPQAIALAATFDTLLMHKVAEAIATESGSRGLRMILSPVINLARDVRWGRCEETYGEDPFLTSAMGLAYVSEMERAGLITTPKHFAVNSADGGRDSYPVNHSEPILDEIFFKAFKTCLEKGTATSVMTSYNSLNGIPCSANPWLLNTKLRNEWGFNGFVISDANAVGGANVLHFTASDYADAGAKAIKGGLDVIFQTDYNHYRLFIPPFLDGTLSPEKINESVRRVLHAKFKLGLFDNPWADPQEAQRVNGCAAHRSLALEAALKSIVLLKNNGVLPISKSVKTVAVIGTDAKEARLGGYSGPGNKKTSLADGLTTLVAPDVDIIYEPGCGRADDVFEVVPAPLFTTEIDDGSRNGITTEFFDNPHLEGTPVKVRVEPRIQFRWTLLPPCEEVDFDWFSVRCTTTLTPDQTGEYLLGIEGNDGYRLWIDNKLLIDNWEKKSYGTKTAAIHLKQGKSYPLKFEYRETSGSAWIKLVWRRPGRQEWESEIDKAVAAAMRSDLIIANVGLEEGEGLDRARLNLPGHQEALLDALATTGKPLVVVITGGSAVTMDRWLAQAGAVLMAWYPGEAGGEALASILFGEANPAGRLPITFPMHEGQLPLYYNHQPTGRNDDYGNLTGKPLFPFGYGLSYTTFKYGNLKIDKPQFQSNDTVHLRFSLTNTGTKQGDEVYQLYVRDVLSTVARPIKELKGFGRVTLAPGETKEVEMTLTPAMLSFTDEKGRWITEPGDFRVMVGASSEDIRLRGKITFQQNAGK